MWETIVTKIVQLNKITKFRYDRRDIQVHQGLYLHSWCLVLHEQYFAICHFWFTGKDISEDPVMKLGETGNKHHNAVASCHHNAEWYLPSCPVFLVKNWRNIIFDFQQSILIKFRLLLIYWFSYWRKSLVNIIPQRPVFVLHYTSFKKAFSSAIQNLLAALTIYNYTGYLFYNVALNVLQSTSKSETTCVFSMH